MDISAILLCCGPPLAWAALRFHLLTGPLLPTLLAAAAAAAALGAVAAVTARRAGLPAAAGPDGPELLAGMLSAPQLWARLHADLLRRRRRPPTIEAYRFCFQDFCAFLKPRPWHRARLEDLDRWLARRAHERSNAHGPELSASTKRAYASRIYQAYRWAAAQRLLARNPFEFYVLPPSPRPLARALDRSEVAGALDAATTDPRDLLMLVLAYGCGLRAGEVARLRLEDVALGDRPAVYIHDSKGGRSRVVDLSPLAERELARLLRGRPRRGPAVEHRTVPGRHVKPATVTRQLRRILAAGGLEANGHRLRHAYATHLRDAGADMRDIQHLLGHAYMATTELYVLGSAPDTAAAAALLPDPRQPPPHDQADVEGLDDDDAGAGVGAAPGQACRACQALARRRDPRGPSPRRPGPSRPVTPRRDAARGGEARTRDLGGGAAAAT